MMDYTPFKDFLLRPKLTHYLSQMVEIGFTQYGPTIIVAGSLTAVTRVVFINEMSLTLMRKRDTSRFRLTWFAFRPHSFDAAGMKGHEMKMASKFMVTLGESHPYSLIFTDEDRYSYCKPIFTRIKKLWEKHLQTHGAKVDGKPPEGLFESFAKDNNVLETLKELRKMSYWEEGPYSLLVRVTTTKPQQDFDVLKSFDITKDDMNIVNEGPVNTLADLCKEVFQYKFASVVMR